MGRYESPEGDLAIIIIVQVCFRFAVARPVHVNLFINRGGSRGRVQGVCTPLRRPVVSNTKFWSQSFKRCIALATE